MILRIFILIGLLTGTAASAANRIEPRHEEVDRRREAQIMSIARRVFPLAVLDVSRVATPDGAELYMVQLDASSVAGAPQPTITSQIWIVPGATMSMIHYALRVAAAEVRELIGRAEVGDARNRTPVLRPVC